MCMWRTLRISVLLIYLHSKSYRSTGIDSVVKIMQDIERVGLVKSCRVKDPTVLLS